MTSATVEQCLRLANDHRAAVVANLLPVGVASSAAHLPIHTHALRIHTRPQAQPIDSGILGQMTMLHSLCTLLQKQALPLSRPSPKRCLSRMWPGRLAAVAAYESGRWPTAAQGCVQRLGARDAAHEQGAELCDCVYEGAARAAACSLRRRNAI